MIAGSGQRLSKQKLWERYAQLNNFKLEVYLIQTGFSTSKKDREWSAFITDQWKNGIDWEARDVVGSI